MMNSPIKAQMSKIGRIIADQITGVIYQCLFARNDAVLAQWNAIQHMLVKSWRTDMLFCLFFRSAWIAISDTVLSFISFKDWKIRNFKIKLAQLGQLRIWIKLEGKIRFREKDFERFYVSLDFQLLEFKNSLVVKNLLKFLIYLALDKRTQKEQCSGNIFASDST